MYGYRIGLHHAISIALFGHTSPASDVIGRVFCGGNREELIETLAVQMSGQLMNVMKVGLGVVIARLYIAWNPGPVN